MATISVAWFVYRPWLGIPLLAAAVAVIVWLKLRGARRRVASA
jgi:hypothetical protein